MQHLRPAVIASMFGCLVSACTSVPPLDDARLLQVSVGTPADAKRVEEARERHRRETFRGASFGSKEGVIVASFNADEYDAYVAYLRSNHAAASSVEAQSKSGWDFPVLHLLIETERNLFESDHYVHVYRCEDERSRLDALLMWRDRVVWPEADRNAFAAARRDEGTTQLYEIVVDYALSQKLADDGPDRLTLPRLEGDMCVAFVAYRMPFPTVVGAPLRIPKEFVNIALQPLPRKMRLHK